MTRTAQSAKKKAKPKRSKFEILVARRARLQKKQRWEESALEKSTAALAACEAALLRMQSAGPPKAELGGENDWPEFNETTANLLDSMVDTKDAEDREDVV